MVKLNLDDDKAMNYQIPQFSQAVIENLGYYVYFLRDPDTRQIFMWAKESAIVSSIIYLKP